MRKRLAGQDHELHGWDWDGPRRDDFLLRSEGDHESRRDAVYPGHCGFPLDPSWRFHDLQKCYEVVHQ